MNKNNSDDLKMMQDKDIEYLLKSIKREIFKLEKNIRTSFTKELKRNLGFAQIEYCYIKREFDTRLARQEIHQEYLKNIPRKPFQKSNGV